MASQSPDRKVASEALEPWSRWAAISLGVLVPFGDVPEDRLKLEQPFVPAFEVSAMVGAALGRFGAGGRFDVGVGGLAPNNLDRGIGYLLRFGPVARLVVVDSPLQVNLLADATWMRLATSTGGRTRCDPMPCLIGDTWERSQLSFHAVALSASLAVAFRRYFVQLRYVRPYWYRAHDEGGRLNIRDWNFMHVDQVIVSFGFWDDAARSARAAQP